MPPPVTPPAGWSASRPRLQRPRRPAGGDLSAGGGRRCALAGEELGHRPDTGAGGCGTDLLQLAQVAAGQASEEAVALLEDGVVRPGGELLPLRVKELDAWDQIELRSALAQ
jgi:hypothetical protein